MRRFSILACDRRCFIPHIAGDRWAVDIREVSGHLNADVRFVQAADLDLRGQLPWAQFGAVFISN